MLEAFRVNSCFQWYTIRMLKIRSEVRKSVKYKITLLALAFVKLYSNSLHQQQDGFWFKSLHKSFISRISTIHASYSQKLKSFIQWLRKTKEALNTRLDNGSTHWWTPKNWCKHSINPNCWYIWWFHFAQKMKQPKGSYRIPNNNIRKLKKASKWTSKF